MERTPNLRRQVARWRLVALITIVLLIAAIVALVVIVTKSHISATNDSDVPVCGESTGKDASDQIDLREPDNPGPFHDLTRKEIAALRTFLEKDPKIKARKAEEAVNNSSFIFMMDLFHPKKSEVLKYLDKKGKQPARQARVIMFRGDLKTPQTEEYICGPLPKVSSCKMLESPNRRNPVEFSVKPFSPVEFGAMEDILLAGLDKKIGHILRESFGTSYTNCEPRACFKMYPSPVASSLHNNASQRIIWLWAQLPVDYYALNPSGFAILADVSGSDPEKWMATKAWYNNKLYDSLDELVSKYDNNEIEKVKREFPDNDKVRYSNLMPRKPLTPDTPKRPPTLVEPDGKRYTLKDRKVDYLDWTFNFRMSALTGPSLFDIRFRKERIAYELGLAEVAVFYSSNDPMHRITDYVDSGALLGSHSKGLVPGADCPESATFINMTFPGQVKSESVEIERAFCLFENNNGYPLRRHLSYSTFEGGYYGGLQDSVIVLRSSLTIANYDYIVDFMFHQNGVIETRIMSTGYIFPSVYYPSEKGYGFHIEETIVGNIHHHMFHFKADLDIGGTSNRYETLDIKSEEVTLRVEPNKKYHQTKFVHNLRHKEKDALYNFNFDEPKYHVVHNNAKKTKFQEIKAYRIGLHGMSKQILPEGSGNERTIPWARHQLVVTKRKDDEVVSSSPYAMWDSANPVTNFTKFYDDDEDIVDKDLVFWVTQGMHHIPHTEDLPVTPTVGNHLTFFLLPYNYFDECPSMNSRDQIYVSYKDPSDPKKGVKVERNGLSDKQCLSPKTAEAYRQLLEDDPDVLIESKRFRGIF